jgi:hypothetical protein
MAKRTRKARAGGGSGGHSGGSVGGRTGGGALAGGRYFADPAPSPLDTGFQTPVTDEVYYQYLVKMAQPVPAPARTPVMGLDEVLGAGASAAIEKTGRIVFHCAGDTGPVKGPESLNGVVEAMMADFGDAPADQPQFLYHLGDVVYNFGEPEYYYEQFYEPFRDYPAPVFAIPGNHDGMVYQSDRYTTLQAFQAQFCAAAPVHPAEAGGLARTAMTQPGVYFTLEAPFVTLIGLYSNALENPGVISSEGGRYPQVSDDQKTFLTAELKRVKSKPGAVIVSTHHPPYSGDARHGGSPVMLKEIDECVQAAGFAPDAVLSGHAHLYQRFTRTTGTRETPYIVAGTGGHGLQKLHVQPGGAGLRTPVSNNAGDVKMEKYLSVYGYLRITASADTLMIEFLGTGAGGSRSAMDRVVVNLKTHRLSGASMPLAN